MPQNLDRKLYQTNQKENIMKFQTDQTKLAGSFKMNNVWSVKNFFESKGEMMKKIPKTTATNGYTISQWIDVVFSATVTQWKNEKWKEKKNTHDKEIKKDWQSIH